MHNLIKDHKKFSEAILFQIQKMPFGSLPKSELELVILDALLRALDPINPYSSVEQHFDYLKRELKLSHTQLRNKIFAAQLRYDIKQDKDVEYLILHSVINENYSIEGSYLVFTIFNPLMNDLTKSYFETRNIITDASFNKSILKININGFIKFLYQCEMIEHKDKVQFFIQESLDKGFLTSEHKTSSSSVLEKIDRITSVGANLLTFLEKLNPLLTNILS
jgi:hypothetical protein